MRNREFWKRGYVPFRSFADPAAGEPGGGSFNGGTSGAGAAGEPGGAGGEKKYSDDDVNAIIDKKFARWKEQQKKELEEAKKKASMDAQQQAEYERDQLQQKLDELTAAQTRSEMISLVRKVLSDGNISVPDELLGNIVGADADATKKTADAFVKVFNDAVQEGVKAALKGKTPPSGGASAVTKEEIMKIKDTRERQQAIRKHPELFQRRK